MGGVSSGTCDSAGAKDIALIHSKIAIAAGDPSWCGSMDARVTPGHDKIVVPRALGVNARPTAIPTS
jgi:hypothetical protein